MTREVVKTDDKGKAVVVVYRESAAERVARRAAIRQQAERGREVAASLRRTKST